MLCCNFRSTCVNAHFASWNSSGPRLTGSQIALATAHCPSKVRASVWPIPRVDLSYHRYTQHVCKHAYGNTAPLWHRAQRWPGCTHKSRLVSSGWSMSALLPAADIRQRIEHVCFVPKMDVGRWQSKLTSSGRGRRPHSRRILDDRASLWLYHCPIVRAHTLSVLWGDLDLAKSAYHRMYRLPDTVGRRIRQLDDQTTPARASPDRRH